MPTQRKTAVSKHTPPVIKGPPGKPVAQKIARGATRVTTTVDGPAFQKAKPYVGTQSDKVFSLEIPDDMDPAAVSAQVAFLLKNGQLFNRSPAASVAPHEGKDVPKSSSPINDSIVSIDQELDALHDSIGALADSLEPVLAYPEPEAKGCVAPDPASASQSPLHNRLIDLRFRLGVATERVRIITSRVRT